MQNYIIHSGIKGQKWGIRRYQNEDGTLTEAGKARYYKDTSGKLRKKRSEYMSDEELRKANARLQAEKQYDLLTDRGKIKKNIAVTGISTVGSFLGTAGAYSIAKIVDKGSIDKSDLGKAAIIGSLAALVAGASTIGALSSSQVRVMAPQDVNRYLEKQKPGMSPEVQSRIDMQRRG